MSNPTRSLGTRTIARSGESPSRQLRTYRLEVLAPESARRALDVSTVAFRIGTRPENDLAIADETMSRVHCEIVCDEHGHRLRDLGSTNGTYVDGMRASDVYLRSPCELRLGSTLLRFSLRDVDVDVPASGADRFGPLLGSSVRMREVFAILEKAAPTHATVLIEGETGTGKEVVAQAIHQASPRAGAPFVVFDCASVASNLLESELFGHERGAFTGATERREGRMEEADGGTLFIDELGELPIELQPKLLRALERREIRPLGSTKTISVNIRLIAATNRDLAREINDGTFREDLFYRLAVVRVQLPPLRDRPDDVRVLVEHFVRRALADDPKQAAKVLGSIRDEQWQRLRAHPWRGNVRELRNVVERMLALSDQTNTADIDLTRASPGRDAASAVSELAGDVDLSRPFSDLKAEMTARFEERYLVGQLDRHGGNYSRAAAAAGLDRMYFKRLLQKYRD